MSLCLPLQVELLKSRNQQNFKSRSQSPVKYKYPVTPQTSKKFPSANHTSHETSKAQHRTTQSQTKGIPFPFWLISFQKTVNRARRKRWHKKGDFLTP